MPKKIFKIVIGAILCFITLFVISSRAVNAFDLFGFLKPGKQEAYQVQGSFDAGPLIADQKQKALKSGPVPWREVYTGIPTTNIWEFKVSNDGDVSGSGEVGHITARWTAEWQGDSAGMTLDQVGKFSFSGKARGDRLEGEGGVKILSYVSGQLSQTGPNPDTPFTWMAERKKDQLEGKLETKNGLTITFTGTIGQVSLPTPSPADTLAEPFPSPQPSPSSGEKRRLQLLDLEGAPITKGKARIRLKDGTIKEVDINNGEIVYDSSLTKMITVEDLNNPDRKLTLQGNDLEREKMIMAAQEEWLNQMMPKLETLAKLLNDGQEVDLNKLFEINPNSDKTEHKPPLLDFLRKFGFKDKIDFDAEQMAWTSDVNTVIHEILGHAFTEVIGEGNKMIYGGAGSHDDPWQPAYKERSVLNPARWFGGKIAALSEDQAKGMALSEGWAQYVGDKWDRELKNIPDEESEYNIANAQTKMIDKKDEIYGKLYDQEGYGAKVENVVATAFNEIYKGKTLEEVVADFAAVREESKRISNGKPFQTIYQFIVIKMNMVEDGLERERIEGLVKDLVLE